MALLLQTALNTKEKLCSPLPHSIDNPLPFLQENHEPPPFCDFTGGNVTGSHYVSNLPNNFPDRQNNRFLSYSVNLSLFLSNRT